LHALLLQEGLCWTCGACSGKQQQKQHVPSSRQQQYRSSSTSRGVLVQPAPPQQKLAAVVQLWCQVVGGGKLLQVQHCNLL
jgi:hypothetical protein